MDCFSKIVTATFIGGLLTVPAFANDENSAYSNYFEVVIGNEQAEMLTTAQTVDLSVDSIGIGLGTRLNDRVALEFAYTDYEMDGFQLGNVHFGQIGGDEIYLEARFYLSEMNYQPMMGSAAVPFISLKWAEVDLDDFTAVYRGTTYTIVSEGSSDGGGVGIGVEGRTSGNGFIRSELVIGEDSGLGLETDFGFGGGTSQVVFGIGYYEDDDLDEAISFSVGYRHYF